MTTATNPQEQTHRDLSALFVNVTATTEKLARENKQLVEYIEQLRRGYFGRSSEKVDPDQLKLFADEAMDDAPAAPTAPAAEKRAPAKGHGRKPFAAHLPRVTIVHDVADADCHCDECKERLVAIGEDVCERGHLVPAKVVVNRHVTKKYACPNGHMVKSGVGAPAGVVEKAKFEASVYAHVAVAKYGDHLPLNRQETIFKRQGLELSKSTMVDMIQLVHAKAAAPIVEVMRKEILAEPLIQADETPITVLLETEHGTKTGYVWVYRAKKKVVFVFRPSRERDGPIRFLGDWKGTLQTDGYAGYDEVVRRNGLVRAGCWAHTRRKWKDAFDAGSADAARMIGLIQRLYRIEAALKTRGSMDALSPAEFDSLRLKVRGRRSRPLVGRIAALVDEIGRKPSTTPQSLLGKAVGYTINQWPTLQVFLADGAVEIDTNAVERAIRPIAVGRKNWLFAGSTRGADAAASLYSLINACKALAINPEIYLADVLELASPNADFNRLTPWAWAEARGMSIA